ncbi:MAG: DNA repair protein RecO [Oscillospiraceae bacterium]
MVREKTIGRDRAIWFLTEKLGTVNVYLKGAAATRSKFAPCTQLFCLSEINLFQNKESYSLNTCDVINSFFSLRENLEALSLASYFSEVTMDTAPDNEEAGEYFSLLLNCFFLIQQGK